MTRATSQAPSIPAEEVEALAAELEREALLSALAAADALHAQMHHLREALRPDAAAVLARAETAERERDAAREDAARLAEALCSLHEAIASELDRRAKEAPLGATFDGGLMHGGSVHNFYAYAARCVRAIPEGDLGAVLSQHREREPQEPTP